MLRTILILTVVGLTTSLNASNNEVKKSSDKINGHIKSHAQCLMSKSHMPLTEVVLSRDESVLTETAEIDEKEIYVAYEIEEVTISAKRLNNNGLTDPKDRSTEDVVYEIEEVTISAKRLNNQYLSAR